VLVESIALQGAAGENRRPGANGRRPQRRWDLLVSAAEASGRLVGPPVFKTGEGAKVAWRVRFPSASAKTARSAWAAGTSGWACVFSHGSRSALPAPETALPGAYPVPTRCQPGAKASAFATRPTT